MASLRQLVHADWEESAQNEADGSPAEYLVLSITSPIQSPDDLTPGAPVSSPGNDSRDRTARKIFPMSPPTSPEPNVPEVAKEQLSPPGPMLPAVYATLAAEVTKLPPKPMLERRISGVKARQPLNAAEEVAAPMF